MEPLAVGVVVPLAPADAFDLFTRRIGTWWPRATTFSRRRLASIHFDPDGGRWYERDDEGEELAWGRIVVWEPPQRLVVTWQITAEGRPEPDPARASEVELHFEPEGAGTRLQLEHRAFERHGDEPGRVWREGMASDQGWSNILGRYVSAAESGA
jgi:uncharacterized protein YndB with AHSA1/START domain